MRTILVLALICIATSVNAQQNVTLYYESGAIKASFTHMSDLIEATYFYEDGNIKEHGFFKDGYHEGSWTKWDVNGNIIAEATYIKGEKSGKWLHWVDNGKTLYTVEYEENTIVDATTTSYYRQEP